MATISVQFRNIAGTEAAVGWAGGKTLVVDRPDGRAGGLGIGFNGGQLLALSLGGCLCNDIRYVAHSMGIAVDHVEVDVDLTLEGEPLLATAANVRMNISSPAPPDQVTELLRRAEELSTIGHSLRRGFPVTITR